MKINDVNQLIRKWPTREDFRKDISTSTDTVSVSRVEYWVRKNNIPKGKGYTDRIMQAAQRRDIFFGTQDLRESLKGLVGDEDGS